MTTKTGRTSKTGMANFQVEDSFCVGDLKVENGMPAISSPGLFFRPFGTPPHLPASTRKVRCILSLLIVCDRKADSYQIILKNKKIMKILRVYFVPEPITDIVGFEIS